MADEYRARGIHIDSHNGDCGDHLDDALQLAKGASLFVFLDPCGAVLPMDSIKDLLRKRGTWPRTEVLLNFSADLIRRAGGQLKKGQLDLGGVAKADSVCDGEWWREVALHAHEASGAQNSETAAESVTMEYAQRLVAGTKYGSVVAPVRRQVHHQPVYYLIFLSQDQHGFWVFGVAAAKAREKWIDFLGPDPDEREGMLWTPSPISFRWSTPRQSSTSLSTCAASPPTVSRRRWSSMFKLCTAIFTGKPRRPRSPPRSAGW